MTRSPAFDRSPEDFRSDTGWIAALPMYDWPECRAELDAQWAAIRDALTSGGVAAPEALVRSNRDLPAVPGGIRNRQGVLLAPDPATLPPDGLDFQALWLHPLLLFAQTCWGPMEQGLAAHVTVVGQPSYDGFEGGRGELYSSALVMRRGVGTERDARVPINDKAILPLDLLRGKRLAYNSSDSMSGIIALTRDLEALGENLDIFSHRLETGAHRASIIAVSEGRADVCAIDCRSWAMAQQHEPAAHEVHVVGWTVRRKGLPFIAARTIAPDMLDALRDVLSAIGEIVSSK